MNDRRFIELLNLYVDQELSEDAARQLEQEIAGSLSRRRVYSQYCRMQRACVKLLDQPQAPAPRISELAAARSGEAAPREVVPSPVELDMPVPSRGTTVWWGWGSGVVAAAACIALVFVSLGRQDAGERANPAGAAIAAVAEEQSAADATAAASTPTYRRVLGMDALPWAEGKGEGQRSIDPLEEPSLAWLEELKLTPMRRLSFESLQFDSRGGVRETGDPAPTFVHGDADQAPPAELHAFEFQR